MKQDLLPDRGIVDQRDLVADVRARKGLMGIYCPPHVAWLLGERGYDAAGFPAMSPDPKDRCSLQASEITFVIVNLLDHGGGASLELSRLY